MKRSKSNTPNIANATLFWLPALLLGLIWILGGCATENLPAEPPKFAQATDAYGRGLHDYREGLYESAAREFHSVPSSHPKAKLAKEYDSKAAAHVAEASRHLSAAQEYQAQGELYQARRELEALMESYPRYRNARALVDSLDREIDRAVELNFEEGKQEYEKKQYERARESFLTALKANPDDERAVEWLSVTNNVLFKIYLEEGRTLSGRGLLDEAIGRLERSHQMNPAEPAVIGELTVAYNRRALKNYREENLSLAVHDLRRSLELKPDQKEIRGELKKIQQQIDLLRKIGP